MQEGTTRETRTIEDRATALEERLDQVEELARRVIDLLPDTAVTA